MNYQCCHCEKIFPTKDAIDGYPHGFKTGFLCPHCDANIKDSPFNENWVFSSSASRRYYRFMIAYIAVAAVLYYWLSPAFEQQAFWFHGAVLIPFLLLLGFGYFRYADLFRSPTLRTEAVADASREGIAADINRADPNKAGRQKTQ